MTTATRLVVLLRKSVAEGMDGDVTKTRRSEGAGILLT